MPAVEQHDSEQTLSSVRLTLVSNSARDSSASWALSMFGMSAASGVAVGSCGAVGAFADVSLAVRRAASVHSINRPIVLHARAVNHDVNKQRALKQFQLAKAGEKYVFAQRVLFFRKVPKNRRP